MNKQLIRVTKLTKYYKNDLILNNISFNVYENNTLAIVGLNGTGKTTILTILAQLQSFNGGQISYDQSVLYKNRLNIDFVFQNFLYNKMVTVSQTIKLICNLQNIDFKEILDSDIASFFNIKDIISHRPINLSGGQRKTFEIFCALMHKPKIIFFDELLTGLDTAKKRPYLEFIRKYCRKNNITIVAVVHDILELEYLADEIIIIKDKTISNVKLQHLNKNARNKKINLVVRNLKKGVIF